MKSFALLLVLGLISQAAFAVVDGDPTDKGDEHTFLCQFTKAPCAPNDYYFRKAIYAKWSNEFKTVDCQAAMLPYVEQLKKVEEKLGKKDIFEISATIYTYNHSPVASDLSRLAAEAEELSKAAKAADHKATTCGIKIKSRDKDVYFSNKTQRFFLSEYWLKGTDFNSAGEPIACLEKLEEAKADVMKLMPHITRAGSILQGEFCGVRYFPINVVTDQK